MVALFRSAYRARLSRTGLALALCLALPAAAEPQAARFTGFAALPEVVAPFTGFTAGGLSFQATIPATPTYFDEFLAEYAGVTATFRQGARTLDVSGAVIFFVAELGGGLIFSTDAGEVLIDAAGPQLFTGSTESPRFRVGVFSLENFEDAPAVLIVQRSFTIAAVPEPPAAGLLLTAACLVPLALRRRRGHPLT